MAHFEETLACKVANDFSNIKFTRHLFTITFLGEAPHIAREHAINFGMDVLHRAYLEIKDSEEFPNTMTNYYSPEITALAKQIFEGK